MKKVDVIIFKSIGSNTFYVGMRGHFPNESFKSVVSERQTSYKDAFWIAKTMCRTVSLLGHEVTEMNDSSAEKDGRIYCDEMAFEELPTWDGKDRS